MPQSVGGDAGFPLWLDRQLTVGDRIIHPTYGEGTLCSGWDGYLAVDFPEGPVTFRGADECHLVPLNGFRAWQWVTPEEARRWIQGLEAERARELSDLRRGLQADFLRTDARFSGGHSILVSPSEFLQHKATFIQQWVRENIPIPRGEHEQIPDNDQATAIGAVQTHSHIVARAGSGKTETLANRAVFLQQHCGVAPGEMLLLAFNREAAAEMAMRIAFKLNGRQGPHVFTFHALALAIVGRQQNLVTNNESEGDQSLNREFQRVIDDHLGNDDFLGRVRRLMLAHFRADWDCLIEGGYHLDRDAMLWVRRNLARETLRGEYVKSYGEKLIANYLFEHGIPYRYEQNHNWSGFNYRPDFTLTKGADGGTTVIIEYFGLIGDPDYDAEMQRKREYWQNKGTGWAFVELAPNDISGGAAKFESRLKRLLDDLHIPTIRLSEDEIWRLARDRAIDRFTQAMTSFVGRCRKAWILPAQMRDMITSHQPLSEIEEWFLDLAVNLYEAYLRRLEDTGQEDFDGLMQHAATLVESGQTKFERRDESGDLAALRYIFIDEYQDFSELFHRLISAIRQCNGHLKLFCVGDDWQAINGFAGSDLKFYQDFEKYVSPSERKYIPTNYRSTKPIVDAGNALMAGHGEPARSAPSSIAKGSCPVYLADLAEFRTTLIEEQRFSRGSLTPAVLRLAGKALSDGKSVVVLNRRRTLYDPAGGKLALDQYLGMLRRHLPNDWRRRLHISTTHGFKGNQSDVIIILDALARSYPLIHPDWVFARVLGESVGAIVEENRRLFYVAMTRAKEQLFIITERNRESPFVDEIRRGSTITAVNWQKFPPLRGETEWVVVSVRGPYDAMVAIRDALKTDGYQYRDLSGQGRDKTWDKSFARDTFSFEALMQSPWGREMHAKSLNDIVVEIRDDLDHLVSTATSLAGALHAQPA